MDTIGHASAGTWRDRDHDDARRRIPLPPRPGRIAARCPPRAPAGPRRSPLRQLPVRLLAGLLAFLLTAFACSTARPRRVILILLDAARADRFSFSGYPHPTTPRMDELARRGVVFTSTFSQATSTRAALPSIFYSRYYVQPMFPGSDQIPFAEPEDLFRALDGEAISLPESLGGAGFHRAMISAHSWLREGTVFASTFDEMHDMTRILPVDPAWEYPRARDVIDYTIDWLAKQPERDTFLYLHLMDTHFPHHMEAEGGRFLESTAPALLDSPPPDRFTATGAIREPGRPLSPAERAWLDALYDGDLAYADAQVGRLIDALGTSLDDTLIVITSDHGEHLLEVPGRFRHGGPWYDIVARVPLIVFHPGAVAPGRVDFPVESVDIMPTILDLIGVEVPAGRRMDGRSILPLAAGGEAGVRPVTQDAVALRAIRTGGWKCFFTGPYESLLGRTRPAIEDVRGVLYDLDADPLETMDVWDDHPEVVEALLDRYRERAAPSWRRYAGAATTEPPDGPFAIGTYHFYGSPGTEAVRADESMVDVVRGGHAAGWIADPAWSSLVAGPGAAPLDVTLRIPDGTYLLSAGMRGSAMMSIPGAPPRRLVARPFDPSESAWSADRVEHGVVTVADQSLRVRIDPDAAAGIFLIRYLGFIPSPDGGAVAEMEPEDAEEREERIRRLRTLGYID